MEYIKEYQTNYAEKFAHKVSDAITTPFRYATALTGDQADSFFREIGTTYKLRLGKLNEQYIIVAE